MNEISFSYERRDTKTHFEKVIRNWPIECEVETEIVKTPGNVAHEMSLSKVCAKNF